MLLSSHVIEIRKYSKHILFLIRNTRYSLFLVVRLGKRERPFSLGHGFYFLHKRK